MTEKQNAPLIRKGNQKGRGQAMVEFLISLRVSLLFFAAFKPNRRGPRLVAIVLNEMEVDVMSARQIELPLQRDLLFVRRSRSFRFKLVFKLLIFLGRISITQPSG